MVLALISTLISSIALVGVAVSLIVQGRQLRTSQLQVSRALQTEVIKLAQQHPEFVMEMYGSQDPESIARGTYYNLTLKYLELSYLLNAVSEASVRLQSSIMFRSKHPQEWWSVARDIYQSEAAVKREKRFFLIVDSEFQRAIQPQAGVDSSTEPTTPTAPPSS